MEILDYNLSSLALNIGLVISGMSAVLLMITTAVHWHKDRRKTQIMTFDKINEPLVMSYLEGKTPQIQVIKSMENDPLEAMQLLMEIHKKLPPSEQSRLLHLFAALPHVDNEIPALDSPFTKRRLQAAERLGYLRNEASTEALLHALEDDVLAVRYCAARSLAAHGNTDFIEPTLLAFETEPDIDWLRLVEIVLDYGTPAIPKLLAIMNSPSGKYSNNILNVAVRALGTFKEPRAVNRLIRLLDHSEFSIRLNAARALGSIGDPAAISPVAELSHDPDSSVRNKAIQAIGKLHAESQIPVLVEALADPSWRVRYSAAQSLYSLGQPGINQLNEIMNHTQDLSAHDMCCQVISEHDLHDIKNNPS
jgi:HEAT repeat protein